MNASLIAGGGAALALVVLEFGLGLQLPLWLLVAVGAMFFAGIMLLLPGPRRALQLPIGGGPDAAKVEEVATLFDQAAGQLDDFARNASAATAPVLQRVAEKLRRLAGHVRDDPRDYTILRTLAQHRLELMTGMIARMVRIEQGSAASAETERAAAVLVKFEEVVDDLDRKCLANDLSDLDVDARVLDQLLRETV